MKNELTTVKRIISLVAFALIADTSQAGVTYDLATDFSNNANPNGVWSYLAGSTNLTYHAAINTGNAFDQVATNGYWGASTDYNSTVTQVTGNGSTAPGYNDDAFLTGNVVIHSTNPGTGGNLTIAWTAPSAGSILYSGSVWYAHPPVTRSNDFELLFNNSVLASGSVAKGNGLSNPLTFSNATSINVAAGQVLSLQFAPTQGQIFGSLTGVNLAVNFNASPVPVPAAAPLMLSGLLGFSALRRKNIIRKIKNRPNELDESYLPQQGLIIGKTFRI